ncbi:unnamed protein product [Porites evermanni]|uniref:Uncharacterized protein n=1 Tax=Porites evermanni TaxID=104178 RepID=A0ABN8M514_9CNID|nr:unnamed protein product [Porites evermanni]
MGTWVSANGHEGVRCMLPGYRPDQIPFIPFGGTAVIKCNESKFNHKATKRNMVKRKLGIISILGFKYKQELLCAYDNLECRLPNHVTHHHIVVHRENFVDPATGVHTQEAESAWANLKLPIKGRRGIECHDLQTLERAR